MNETLGDNAINRLQLVATLVEREVMRYTPAGVPIVNCLLAYSGQAVEAQTVRQIEFSMEALIPRTTLEKLVQRHNNEYKRDSPLVD